MTLKTLRQALLAGFWALLCPAYGREQLRKIQEPKQ